MLTKEEKYFLEYWEKNRLRKKRLATQLSVGLPMTVLFLILVFINVISGWYKRAKMEMNSEPSLPSLILILIVAALLIVVFVAIFSARHKWEMNEQRYKELLSRQQDI